MAKRTDKVTTELMQQWELLRPIPDGSKLTPVVVAAILQSIANGAYIEASCVAAGIARRTFYYWLEKAEEEPDSAYAEFVGLLERARAQAELANVNVIKSAAEKNWQAAAWLLERTHPDKYGMKNRTTVDGSMLHGHAPAASLIAAMREGANGKTES